MPMTFKQFLEKLIKEKAPGPSPTFSVFHVVRALEFIAEKNIGRGRLAESLEVGEGAMRTLIGRLKDAGLIEISKSGCALTSKGLKLWREYKSVFSKKVEVGKNELAIAKYNVAILIKNRGHKIKLGVEQRDAAVMAGAKGATTIIFSGGHLVIPSVSNAMVKDFPKASSQIMEKFDLEENDVIIIGSADTLGKAECGALAAAWTLLNDC